MKLIKRNPLDLFFNEDFLNWPASSFERRFNNLPAVNISENENSFQLDLAVPGMKKEDFKIELDNDILTISAEVKNEKEETNENGYSRREFSSSSFSRSFTLPENKVSEESIKANYENGVLSVNLPKKTEAKPKASKMIEIG